MLKSEGLRKFGLGIVGEIPWGTHLCEFYQTKEDLIDILVPYFKAGLENNEFCMWITSPPLDAKQAKEALEKAVPELDDYIKKGQIQILPYKEWYLLNGKFDADQVLQGWVEKETNALSRGFDGLRLTGNTFWVERSLWKSFADYEAAVNAVITLHRIIALCSYSLEKCTGLDMVDVLRNHVGTLIRGEKDWYLVEDVAHRKEAEGELAESEHRYRSLFANMNSAFAYHKIVLDDYGKPIDYVFLEVNEDFEKLTGLRKEGILGKRVTEVLPGIEKDPANWIGIYGKVAITGDAVRFENYSQNLKKWYSVSAYSPVKGCFASAFDDITERKQAEIALRESEHRWATTLSSIGDAVIATDIAGKITFMNHIAEGLTGWTLAEASNKPLKEVFCIVNEHSRKEVENPVARVLEKGLIIGLANHTLLIRKDGTEIPIDDSGAPIKDEKGEIVGVVLVFRDIAERRKMEAELSNLAKFPSENPNVILRLSKDGKLLYSNPASKRLLGNWLENLNLSLPEHWRKNLTEALSSGKKLGFEEQISESTFSFTFAPIVSEGYVNVYAEDITERKKAEEVVLESEERLNRSQEIAHLGSWELDLTNNRLTWSDEVYRIFGLQPQEFSATYEAFLDAVHPDDRAAVDAAYSGSLREGRDTYEIEHRVVRRSTGEIRIVYEKCNHIRDGSGRIIRSVGMVHDITERKKADRELVDTLEASHRRQAEVSALLEASKAVLVNREFSKAARSIFASCKDLLGATAGYVALLSKDKRENEVLFLDSGGLPCVVDPSLPMPIRGLRAEAYSTGKVVYCNDFTSSEWASLMPEGHVVLKNVLFAPLTIDGNTVGIIGLANKTGGFTERDAQMAAAFGEIASVALINSQMLEKLEENEKLLKAHSERLEEMVEEKTKLLRDAERLAAIGQTAGMVGHDIRNPLQAIIGDVYLAKSDVASMPEDAKKESLQESLLAIEKNADYINKIVADLQDYAKPLRPHTELTDLKTVINDLLTKNGLPESIQINVKVTKEAREVMADSAYVKRIIGNLITNAVQAMPNGGKLLINAYNEAGNAVITVEDTGIGIPDEAKPKLFTPLFTTKSKGQGFGLAVVKRLTEALNGTVTLESKESKGTKFTITLPQET